MESELVFSSFLFICFTLFFDFAKSMIKKKVFPLFLYGFSGDVELIKILKYNTVKESSAK